MSNPPADQLLRGTRGPSSLDLAFEAERVGRQLAEESLRQSEATFRLLVESVTEYAIFMLDPEGHVVTWNLGAERIKGYRAEEIIGRHFSIFYLPEAVAQGWPSHELAAAISQGRFEDEGWRVCKDGSLFWANVIITAVYDRGRLRGFSKVTRDLTERKRREEELLQARDLLEERVRQRTDELTRANEALQADVVERERLFEEVRQREERFSQLVLALPAAVYTTDREGRITLYNEHAAALWGRRPEIGKDLWCGSFYMLRPDGTPLPHDECPMALALREGRSIRGQEIIVERPDGTRACVLPHPEPLHDATGEIVGAVNMLIDISERKQAEEELRGLEAALREKVEELAAADRRKNEFLATLAHELRNPLAPLRHGLQLLHLAEEEPEIRQQALGMMERQLGQLVRLVDDLLDVSRISSNKLRLRKERIELAVAIRNAVETTRPLFEEAGHELTVTLPPEPVYLDADLTRLAQVFINLLNNAAKYTERGGHVWLCSARQGGEIVVSVRDTGIGITAEHLPHLFEIFSQITPALERSDGGLGIGLSLVRGLAELHGGNVEARSAGAGMGSEFIVRLPVAEGPAREQQAQNSDQQRHRAGPKCRILVADDNRDSADGLSTLLELKGYEVQTAHDGLDAVQSAAAFRPDVALMDIGMPRVNGYEAARRIRQKGWGKGMVLIAITGWGQDEDKQRAKEAGFDHHLTKPIEPAELEKLLVSVTAQVNPPPPG
jgi:PAS domain S-box-containing protein